MIDARPEARVALVTDRSDRFGGGQESLIDLAAALGATAYRPLVVVPRGGPLTDALETHRVEWAALPMPRVLSWPGRVTAAIAALRRLARDRGIGVLHSDSPRAAFYAGLAARLEGARHVFHARSSRASSEIADAWLVLTSDRVVAVSKAAADRSAALRASHGVRVVPTGIPPFVPHARSEARRLLDLPDDAFVCGVIGRVEADKGRDEAIRAMREVRRAAPGALLVFVGAFDDADPWIRTCGLRAAAAGVPGAVRLAGPVAGAARLLTAFDAILHPSHHEALPRVVIEALLAGVPVVAAAVGGVPEIITSGKDGLLVPPRDAYALGSAAAGLARDPAEAARLAAAGRAGAAARFRMETMTGAGGAVYAEILRARPAAAGGPGARAAAADAGREARS